MTASRWSGFALPLIIAAGLGTSSCGDDESVGSEGIGLSSEPARLVSVITRDSAAAKNAKDCKEVAKINRRSIVKVVCPPVTSEMRRANATLRPYSAATYGTGAVVDYRSRAAKKGASVVLYRNADGKWVIGHWGLLYGPTVGTDDDEDQAESALAVDRYLTAIRDESCQDFLKFAVTQGSGAKACRREFPRGFAEVLQDNPKPKVSYIGGNEDLRFYRLSLQRPASTYTVSTIATSKGALRSRVVLGVVLASD